MSEKFYEKFLVLFFYSAILLILFMLLIQFLIFYFQNQNIISFLCYAVTLFACGLYGIRYYRTFRDFKEQLSQGLLFPNSDNERPLEPLDIELEDVSLKVCLYYQQGATFEDIKRNLGLNHPTKVKRELQKGLRFLLQFYNEHRDNHECER